MVNYDRGVYEPGDDVRVFDGAEEEEDVEGSRLPLLIVLALLVLAMFGGVVYLAYTQGVARGRGETPVLTAAAGPERVAPQSPGGARVPYQGFKIYEQPAPQDDPADATPQTTPQTTPVTQAAAPPKVTQQATPQVTQSVPAPSPVAKPAPAKMEKPVAPAPAPVVKTPAAKPAAAPPSIATGAPRQLGAAIPAPTQVAPPLAPAVIPAGAYVLQIGAYKSQAEADNAWKNYKARHAALLSGFSENVQQADLGEKGTWFRLRVAGFSDKDVASATCERLKADGGACFLGK
jgi:outer membrane biosynthesis protein TonB